MKIKALKALTIRDVSTGDLMSIGHGMVAEVDSSVGNQLIADGLAEAYTLISPTGTKTITANGSVDVTEYASANVNVAATLNVAVAPIASNETVFGKTVSDLQDNVAIAEGSITGTLLYVSDYTGFSSDPSEQSGHYLALKVTAITGATITVELKGGTLGHPVTLDDDGEIVLRIANVETQSIQIVATKGTMSETVDLSIADLVLLLAGD